MKMKSYIYLAVATAMVMVSCAKDEIFAPQTESFTITATISNSETRTSYVDETADPTKGLKVEWEANETISVVELTAGGTYNNKYWTFTSDNVAGAKATFTAPAGFETTEGCKYIAIYPALTDGVNGPYAGVAANNCSALLRENTNYLLYEWGSDDDYRQTGVASMDLLKSYDVMVSAIEFNEGKADIDLAKMFSVIKLDLTLPAEAAGTQIYQMNLASDKDWWLSGGGVSLSNIIEGNYKWAYANSVGKEAIIRLKNSEDTGHMTVPNDCKVSIYLPCPGNKEGQFLMATKFPASSTFTITVFGADGNDYSASKTMGETTTYLMQGTVNVIKATLAKE